jgi:5-formyltetrahydrofolate cyclo-ligase
MEKEELRKNILERIQKIDDINRLTAIQTILNTLDSEQLSLEEVNDALETEDFSGYIKEWLKNM